MLRREFIKSTLAVVTYGSIDNNEMADTTLLKTSGLLCFWDFDGKTPLVSKGAHAYTLVEGNGKTDILSSEMVAGKALNLNEGQYLSIARKDCPALNVHGKNAQVTVLAWIKRERKSYIQCEAVAGMWNETNRLRQYCVFIDLRIHDSANQVGGHISGVGGPTPGFKYCMDASIGKTEVPFSEWTFAAITYDGKNIRAYHNGVFDERGNQNPYSYEEGIFDAGVNGSDFTVGAVHRSNEMGNFFVGQIGGLAVFNRALTDKEIGDIGKEFPVKK